MYVDLALVYQKVDNAVRFLLIQVLIHWITIYLVDSAIQPSNNLSLIDLFMMRQIINSLFCPVWSLLLPVPSCELQTAVHPW